MNPENKPQLLGLLSVLLWSTVATAFKISLTFVTPFQLLFYSSFISFLVYLCAVLFNSKLRNEVKQLSTKTIVTSIILGFLNPFLYYSILFEAYNLLKAQEALVLNYTWAVWLPLFSLLVQKKKIPVYSFFALLISFLGLAVVISKGNLSEILPTNRFGAILALSSALVWCTYWILNIDVSKHTDDRIRFGMNFGFGFLFILLKSLLWDGFYLPKPQSFLPISYVALFEMSITFLVWNKALKLSTNPAKISNLIYLSPVLSLVIINFILGEKIEIYTIFGIALILLGIFIQNFAFFRAFVTRHLSSFR